MIVCADDYGLSDDVDLAILELCGSGKLSAVSCMAALERCTAESLAKLLQHQSRIDVGLHFCLTNEPLPLSKAAQCYRPTSFGELFRRALTRRVNRREIADAAAAQYQLFVEKASRTPDYIDGHLHVHQLPGVRDGLLDFVLSLPANSRPYLRNTYLPQRQLRRERLPFWKAVLIGAFGAQMLKQARLQGIATNDGFAGIYDFADSQNYSTYLPRFVACLPRPNGILVVHPGRNDAWRREEFRNLREFPFPAGTPNRFQH